MNLASMIDYTNLKKDATADDIIKLCENAIKYHFPTVCVPPYYVKAAREYLEGSTVEVCTVIGFPNGYSTKEVKQFEAINAVENGAQEIDMVININALKNKDYDYVKDEIELVRDTLDGKVLKVIIETCLLTDKEIIKMTEICNETFVNFIKTSTGFDKEGATVKDVELIMKHKNDVLEIKASGGISREKDAIALVEAGATRLGTSHGIKIATGCNCPPTCDCGCNEEKECTCHCGDKCDCDDDCECGCECGCDDDCECGCHEGKECHCHDSKEHNHKCNCKEK